MLAGVDQYFLMLRAERAADGGRLDELRPRADDGNDLH